MAAKVPFSDAAEQKVQGLFSQIGVPLSKLPETSSEKRPDFEGQLVDCKIIVEVSHFSDLVSRVKISEGGFCFELKLSEGVDPQHRKFLNKVWDKLPQLVEFDRKHECFRVLALVSDEENFDQRDIVEMISGKSVFDSDLVNPTEVHRRLSPLINELDMFLFFAPESDGDREKVWRAYLNKDSMWVKFARSLQDKTHSL